MAQNAAPDTENKAPSASTADPGQTDPIAILKSPAYLRLLVLAGILGVPISAGAYYYLWLIGWLQHRVFSSIPHGLGFHGTPVWWPVIPLFLAGLIVGPVIRYFPGRGGHSPADGFHAGGTPFPPIALAGVLIASLAGLSLGVVIGPEAPLIIMGGGLGAWAMRLVKKDAPPTAILVMAAAGSFAAISTLLGSPLLGAFLLLEASGLAGPMMAVVLVPGLLAAGIGALIFVGLDSLTGLGTFSLAIPGLPAYARPTGATFGWALAIGVGAALLGWVIRHLALRVRDHVERRLLILTPVLGLVIAGLAIGYAEATGKSASDVLFSGQSELPNLLSQASKYTVGALVLLMICKGLAYSLSLSGFRGGPIFPSMYIGAAIGVVMSHLPGMSLVPGVAMGIGAMCVSMLNLPMTSVLLATLLLSSDAVAVMPLAILSVVVAYVVSAHLPAVKDAATTLSAEPASA